MTRSEVLDRLREHQVEIQQRFGVRSLGLFGTRVDVATLDKLKLRVRRYVEKELIHVA